jgi:glutathione synthase/RimK-type ligase-like ATP-grasp enzyme
MTKESLRKLLQLYNMVYIKPNRGTFGNGVMRIELNPGELQPYRYQKGVKIKTFGDLDAMYRSIREDTRNRPYLVQKGIDLLKYNDRRFDIRVMVQQNPKCKWETTAMIGRVADPRKIVTNFHNGGTLMPVESLLGGRMPEEEQMNYLKKLKRLGLAIAKQLQSRYKGIKEIGADVALDQELRPWVLEVNTCPDPYIFRALPNKRIFKRVARYAKANGRLNN